MKKLILFIFLGCLVIFYACSTETEPDNESSEIYSEDKGSSDSQRTESDRSQEKNIEKKTVYLTFDDGPTSATTDILDTLHQFNAKATFFMLEPSMRESPEVVNKIIEQGHAVGLHGVTHDINNFYKSEQSALKEITTAQETLQQITGVRSNLIRTPYGSVPYLTKSYREVLDSNGFKLWDWNVDSRDWSLSSEQYLDTVIEQIEEQVNAGVTPIILMHDKQNTADHLSSLLAYLSEHGFQTEKIKENTKPYNFNCYQRCHQISTQE
ncbi:polysaccharide deacetylase family protein [Salibacterium qingdaonense]|uniref:Peptidoglycan/xylan/chitin deacetylase, PgdA/CDA1 family n=1 Tax=Salibacterium qingdaonense TaxID=266892 RepID=A0A1I4LVP7_9BACI|nr:polysaccharide deacetylase family protein [Salibacterium qingdaonense]SFL94955.1 Peptidoglycan/xylan/chitin deacetylase, PgdA/CDA1 family [Salibacterium qingdaonense]